MTTLRQALQLKPVHFITIVGRENGLGIDSNLRKPDLIDKVAMALSNPARLPACLSRLTAPEEQALMDLLTAGGRLPARYLTTTYGPLRSPRKTIQAYRQRAALRHLRQDVAQDTALSPLERLGLLGLVFHDPQTNDLFIPDDFISHLPRPELPPPAAPTPAAGLVPVDLLCHDLACLLALLQRDQVSPLNGRWLPPHFLATWAKHCAVSPDHLKARSELKTGRRRFLHYLAEASGLVNSVVNRQQPTLSLPTGSVISSSQDPKGIVSPISNLAPTPAAWIWLNLTRQQRLQTLWQAWTTPDLERWQRFRLPGEDWLGDPARLLEPMHQALLKVDPADPALFADILLKSQPHLVDLAPGNLLNRREVLRDTMVELLVGPLVWLGALSVPGSAATLTGVGEQGGFTSSMDDFFPVPSRPSTPAYLQLTPQGYGFLSGQSLADDDVPPPAKFAITSDIQPDPLESKLTLTLHDGLPDPADLAVALEVGSRGAPLRLQEQGSETELTPAPSLPSTLAHHYIITPTSFILALHRGWSPQALLDALNRLAQWPLTGQETDLLRTWTDFAGRMTIGPAVLLETTDPDIITRLASTRRGRALIHRTLSSRAVVVNPAKLPQLIRRLTEQESVPPKAEGRMMNDEPVHRSSFIIPTSRICG
jgi:hypothetical protein